MSKPKSSRRIDGVFSVATIKQNQPARTALGKQATTFKTQFWVDKREQIFCRAKLLAGFSRQVVCKKTWISVGKKLSVRKATFSTGSFQFNLRQKESLQRIAAPSFSSAKSQNFPTAKKQRSFFSQLKREFTFNSIFTKRAFSSILILVIVATSFFQNSNKAVGATYTWNQTSWAGGQTGNRDVHPGKVGGWDEYASKDAFVKTVNGGNDLQLNWTTGSSMQTSDAGTGDLPNVGGFNAGTHSQTKTRSSGANGRVDLGYGGIAAVASGLGHSLLLNSDNTVWAWGENGSGQLGDNTQTARLTPVQVRDSAGSSYLVGVEALAVGNNHSLALASDGTVWAWGDGASGQLGGGNNSASLLPSKVKNVDGTSQLTEVLAIATGNGFSMALKKDGTVWTWGLNDKGQLGVGTNTNTNLPVQVTSLAQVSTISAGVDSKTALVVTADGTVWTWGDGSLGQLGNGSSLDSKVPVQVTGLTGVSNVSGGKNMSLALKNDKTVWSWGTNVDGELGDGTNNSSNTPVAVLNLTNVNSISAASTHSLAIKTDNTVWSWGNNNKGQLGDGTVSRKNAPVQVVGLGAGTLVSVAGGQSFSLALKYDGSVMAWGWNASGQLGDNTTTDRNAPLAIWGPATSTPASNFTSISSGYAHNLALKSDGTVWAWGNNGFGQLGDGTSISRFTPVQVLGLTNVLAVAAGYNHSLALKNDGTVWAWGWNAYSQLGDGTQSIRNLPVQVKASATPGDYLQNVSAISLGDTHSLALKNDGTVFAWGGNGRGQIGIGYVNSMQVYPQQIKDAIGSGFLTGVSAISAGGYYSLALLTGGTVWSWGANDQGQLGDYSSVDRILPVQVVDQTLFGITNISKISAGYQHSMALKNDGSLLAWGWNAYGQLGTNNRNSATIALPVTGAGTSNVKMVEAGNNHTVMLKNDGTTWAWGWNAYGQLGNGDTNDNITPVQVVGGVGSANMNMISCGYTYSSALTSGDGSVWTWGSNGNGQLGQNSIQAINLPVQVWSPASGTMNVGHTFYFSNGIFDSAIIDSGSFKTFTTLNYNLTTPTGSNVSIDVRAGNNPTVDGSWSTLIGVANGGDISSLGQKRYYQYSVNLTTTDLNVSPSFNDLTLNYAYFPSPGRLISSPYDASDAANILSKISWSRSLSSGTEVQFQVRTAPNQAGVPGTWSAWVGPDGTSSTYFSDNIGGQAMPSLVRDSANDQWLQYQAFLLSDGLSSPTLSDVTMQYVVNAPPEVRNVSASQDSAGLVTVSYEVRDPDTSFAQNVTPGKVAIGLQYCTANCANVGSEVWANASTVGGNVGANLTVEEVNWRVYQLTWNAKSDFAGNFNGANFKVRVKANDSEGANNLGYGNSGNFMLDTKNPVNVNFSIDHPANKLQLTTPNDDSSFQMLVSNFADFHGATYQAFQAEYAYANLPDDPATVFVRIKDAYGNYTTVSKQTPNKLSDIVFYDISNVSTAEYRELISWKLPTLGELGSGGFASYNIWRSVDGGSYTLLNTISDKNVNYYLDSSLSTTSNYAYKVVLQDGDGNLSAFSDIISDAPDAEGGASATAPVLSNVQISSLSSSSAMVTWESDVLADSVVGFSQTAGHFTSEIGTGTLTTSHSVTLTGLAQNTKYYFQVKSISVGNGVTSDDNFATAGNHNGYDFTTLSADVTAPIISTISSTPATTTASIAWTTDENATSFVEYSTNNGFGTGSSYGSYDLSLTHSITLPNLLTPNTTYYFKIHSRDGFGNEAISAQYSVRTNPLGDLTAPTISNLIVVSKTHNTATITWETNETATSFVEYGTTPAYGNTFGDAFLVAGPPFAHSVALPQTLTPETTYHYRVHSTDASNNEVVSIDATFTTEIDPQDIVAPTLTAGPTLLAVSSTSATITWSTNENATSFVEYSPTLGNFQSQQGSSTLTQNHSVTLLNLNPNTAYYYRLKSADASSNTLTVDNGGIGFSFTTNAGQPPVLDGAPVVSKSFDNASISWSTDLNADSFVEYGTLANFSNAKVLGKFDSVKNHTVALANLTASTTYFFRVRSTAEFEMVSGSYSLTTDALPAGPLISAVASTAVTHQKAVITWNTNLPANSFVEYGTTLAYGKLFGSENLNTTHSVTLPADLDASTTYHYRVHSKDEAGVSNFSGDYAFNTLVTPIPDAPQIVVSAPTSITEKSAVLNWTTDLNSDSFAEYGTDTAYGKIFGQSALLTTHSVLLPQDLSASTTYHYRLHSTDSAGNKGVSGDYTFQTLTAPIPAVPQITAISSNPTYNSSTITWATDLSADSYVEYGLNATYGSNFGNSTQATAHTVVLPTALSAATTYHFRVHSTDALGSEGVSGDQTFLTSPTPIPGVPQITNVASFAITHSSASISWNTDISSNSFIEYGESIAYGKIFGSDSLTTTHSLILPSDLSPATTYHFRVRSTDVADNQGTSSDYSFTTSPAPVPAIPQITGVLSASVVHNTAIIIWSTDVTANSYVEYGTTLAYGKSFSSGVSTTSHSVNLPADLNPATAYHYRVHSTNALGTEGISGDYTFTTQSTPVPPAPQFSSISVVGLSHSTATVNWLTDLSADSFVEYGPTVAYGKTFGDGMLTISHSVSLPTDLIPATTYHFRLHSTDAIGSKGVSSDRTFATLPAPIPGMPQITAVATSGITYNSATISWNTDLASDSFVEYGNSLAYGKVFGNGNLTTSHTVALPQDLSPTSTVYYRVVSTDGAGNKGASGNSTFTTLVGPDFVAPLINNVSLSNLTDNGATLNWQTSENTDSILYVGASTNFDKIFRTSGQASTTHTVASNGLQSNLTYFYQIVSKDSAGNVTYGTLGSFTTLSLAGAPVLSNLKIVIASDVSLPATYNQATISWDSDVAGDSKVLFSQDNSFDASVYHPADLVASGHSIVLKDLELDKTYKYKVSTKAANGIETVSGEQSLTTVKDPKYLHSPLSKIEKVVATPASNSASITFSTDQLAKCVIEYRIDGASYPGGLSGESDFSFNHRIQILSLKDTTKYFFRINCQDNIDSTPITSQEYDFTTNQSNGAGSDKVLPVISSVSAGKATGESVVITWNTDKKTSSFVRYGIKSTFGLMMGNDLVNTDQANYVTEHSVTLTSLVPATKYYYSVLSMDASGNIAESSAGTFSTSTQSTLNSISLISKTLGEASTTWTTEQNMTSSVEYGLTNAYGSKSESSSQTKNHQVDLKNLKLGEVYHFRVRSADSAGNIFVSGDYAFQPKSPPIISGISVKDVTESGATVSFNTNVLADAVVAYASVDDPKNSGSQGVTALSLAHTVVLKDLSSGTTFALKVQAKDESGNAAELAGQNFTVGKDTASPVIDQIRTDSALAQNDKVQSIISWTTNENATTTIIFKEGKNGDEKELVLNENHSKNHLAVMTVFKPGVVYFFRAKSVDATGNEGYSSDFALLTPKKKENIIQVIVNNFQDIFHWANM
ncbi:MAG: fibronectin type III domain-containing protein [Candidatus Moraniibacteriota bacterium]